MDLRFGTFLQSCRRTARSCWLRCSGMDVRFIYYASAELRADREVVLAAVQRDERALQYASAELQADREVLLAASDVTRNSDEDALEKVAVLAEPQDKKGNRNTSSAIDSAKDLGRDLLKDYIKDFIKTKLSQEALVCAGVWLKLNIGAIDFTQFINTAAEWFGFDWPGL
jgi:hypothetical protein